MLGDIKNVRYIRMCITTEEIKKNKKVHKVEKKQFLQE